MLLSNEIKVYTEFGIGNATFINTELEFPDGNEVRKPGFVKMKFQGIYFRLWVKNKVFIVSTKNGIVIQTKSKNKFKLLFGILGIKEMSE